MTPPAPPQTDVLRHAGAPGGLPPAGEAEGSAAVSADGPRAVHAGTWFERRRSRNPRNGSQQADVRKRLAFLMSGGGLLLVLLAVASGQPLVLLLGLTVSVASIGVGRVAPALLLPVALLVLVTTTTAVGLVGARLDIRIAGAGALDLILVLLSGSLALVGRRRGGGSSARPAGLRLPILSTVPALIAAGVGLLQPVGGRALEWALTGTDIASHVVMLGDVQRSGVLSYEGSPYPRGWQMLLATVSTHSPEAGSAALLRYDVDLYAGSLWLVFALVLLLAAHVTHAQCLGWGLSSRTASVTSLLLATTMLTAGWMHMTFLRMGSTPVLLAVLSFWVLFEMGAGVSAARARARGLAVGCLCATALMAHLWQGLMVVPIMILLTSAASAELRVQGRLWLQEVRADPRRGAPLLGISAGAAALAAPALLSLISSASIAGVARLEGQLVGPPTYLLVTSPLALLALRGRDGAGSRVVLGCFLGLMSLTGLLLWSSGDMLGVQQYYPRKVLSVLVLTMLPGTASAAVLLGASARRLLLDRAGRRSRIAGELRWGFRIAGLLLTVALAGPGLAAPDGLLRGTALNALHGEGGPGRLALAQEYGSAKPNVYVPSAVGLAALGTDTGFVVSTLLGFRTGQEKTSGNPVFVCDHVRTLQSTGRRVAVLTELPEPAMHSWMVHKGCGGTSVQSIRGGDPAVVAEVTQELVELSRD